MTKNFQKFFPSTRELIQLYSISVFLVFSWTIYLFFDDLNRWLMFMGISELIGVFSYAMVFALFESIAYFFILFLLSFIFNKKVLGSKFIPFFSGITLTGYLWLCFFRYWYMAVVRGGGEWSLEKFLPLAIVVIGVTLIFWLMVTRISTIRNALLSLSERFVVFLYFYGPISVLSLIFLLVANTT